MVASMMGLSKPELEDKCNDFPDCNTLFPPSDIVDLSFTPPEVAIDLLSKAKAILEKSGVSLASTIEGYARGNMKGSPLNALPLSVLWQHPLLLTLMGFKFYQEFSKEGSIPQKGFFCRHNAGVQFSSLVSEGLVCLETCAG